MRPEHAPEAPERIAERMMAAVTTGSTRTMQQDASFGLRELVDVALRALSPGINDPTTAQDAIFHAAAILSEMLRRDPPPSERFEQNRRLVLCQQPTHDDLVNLTFDEIRGAAGGQPVVCVYLLEALSLLTAGLESAGHRERARALRRQASMVVTGCEAADPLPADLDRVKAFYTKRFLEDR